MAFMECQFFSEALGLSTSMNVILPQPSGEAGARRGEKHPVLYLLHGLSDDHTIWSRRTSIERYADEFGLAVVMPCVHRSFYADMVHGLKYWTFVSEELPKLARSFFPLSAARADNFVAGLSMGGYGAFKLALNGPERFAAAASLSGAVDLYRLKESVFSPAEYAEIFGSREQVRGSSNDLFHLAEQAAAAGMQLPALYQCCGTGDFLYEDNLRFLELCRKLNIPVHYEEEPEAIHEWGYWDRSIRKVLNWLPLKESTGR